MSLQTKKILMKVYLTNKRHLFLMCNVCILDQNTPELRDLFNFDNCDPERAWLTNILQENPHDIPKINHSYMIKQHEARKKMIFNKEVVIMLKKI